MRRLIIGVFVVAILAGCTSTPTQDAAPIEDRAPGAAATPGTPGAVTSGVPPSGITGTPGGPSGSTGASVLRDPNNILSRRTIYFDYDSFAVRDEFRALVSAHAKYLQSNRPTRVTLQGHTDERGSREYNLGLGERRGNAVSSALQANGGSGSQVTVVSYGEERPTCTASNEDCWAKNRRVEIVYTEK